MLLPRLAQTLDRPRVALWLARHEHVPLRLLVAPIGAGKTTAVAGFLRGRGRPFAYYALGAQTTPQEFCAAIAATLEFAAPSGFDELVRALTAYGPVQLAVENIETAGEPLREWLGRLIEEGPESLALIYTSRSWDAVDAQRLAAHGLAAICDDKTLAFDAAETAALADLLGVANIPSECEDLCTQAEGWPIVVAGAIRTAFEHDRPLAQAYDHWRKANTQLFRDFLESSAAPTDVAAVEAWDHFTAHGSVQSQSGAERLRRAGLPLRRDLHGNVFCYRVVEQVFNQRLAAATVIAQKAQPVVVRVFGEFKAAFGSTEIKWIRRRDQQIFLYLLLKESGSASRLELCERFWPEAEPELRSASLRVACSNIRRAIGAACGAGNIDAYFRSDGDIAVNFDLVTLDARRFRRHVSEGDERYARGQHQEALAHYRMAESLYGGRIGWCANAEPWLQELAASYESLYEGVLGRLVALHRRAEDAARVREYEKAAGMKLQRTAALHDTPAC